MNCISAARGQDQSELAASREYALCWCVAGWIQECAQEWFGIFRSVLAAIEFSDMGKNAGTVGTGLERLAHIILRPIETTKRFLATCQGQGDALGRNFGLSLLQHHMRRGSLLRTSEMPDQGDPGIGSMAGYRDRAAKSFL